MSEKVDIKTGTKITHEELMKTELSKLAIMTTSPPPSDSVEGQEYRYSAYTRCPWCGHVGWTNGLDSDVYINVICGACGQPFRA
jgi:hypothetical protein